MPTITETFTHADQANNLTADYAWTTWSGSNLGIVSNQAKMTGIQTAVCRLEIDADLSALVTVQATLVTLTQTTAAKYASTHLYLQKDTSTTDTRYGWASRKDNNDSGQDRFFMFKLVGGVFTQLGTDHNQVINANDVMKMTWNPATNTIKGYVNTIELESQVDAAITANTRCGLAADSNDAAFVAIMDTFSLDNAVLGVGQMWLK